MKAARFVVVAFLTLCLVHGVARVDAAPCATASGDSIGEDEARERVRALHAELERNRRHMKIWNATWVSLYGTAAATQATLSVVLDGDDRRVYGVGGARAAIAAAAIPLMGVRTRALTLTGDVCADLAAAESVLADNVRLHGKGRGWAKHAGVVGLNLAAFLTLGLGFDLWERAAIGGGIGLVVGEIQIYSQPMGSRDILRRHEERSTPAAAALSRIYVAPAVGPDHVGVTIGGVLW